MRSAFCWITVVLVICGCAGAQVVPIKDLQKVVEVPGFTKDQIFDAVKIYIAGNFKSAKAVLEYENKVNGTIIGNGRIYYPFHSGTGGFVRDALRNWMVSFTMKIDIKDGRFRCTFDNIAIHMDEPNGRLGTQRFIFYKDENTFYGDEAGRINEALWGIVGAIEQSMTAAKKNDNW